MNRNSYRARNGSTKPELDERLARAVGRQRKALVELNKLQPAWIAANAEIDSAALEVNNAQALLNCWEQEAPKK